jgi:uridine phosphorylase
MLQFIILGGTPKRMEQFAYFIMKEIEYELPPGTILNDISKSSHRYAMFKVGPILSVSVSVAKNLILLVSVDMGNF